MTTLPDYITAMVRRTTPENCSVVPGSTPIVSFGDFQKARVATLGINPSDKELLDNRGDFLVGNKQRFETLRSLDALSTEMLTDEQVRRVFEACENYFNGNQYKWFTDLEKVIKQGLGASYFDGSACHLDLVQWATQTKWGKLPMDVRDTLLADGTTHLVSQLTAENIKYVIVCGRAVWDELSATQLVEYDEVKTIHFGAKNTPCRLRIGHGHNTTFLGWTSNIQSQHGANSAEFLSELSEWLREHTDSLR